MTRSYQKLFTVIIAVIIGAAASIMKAIEIMLTAFLGCLVVDWFFFGSVYLSNLWQ